MLGLERYQKSHPIPNIIGSYRYQYPIPISIPIGSAAFATCCCTVRARHGN